jgi:hypothetical protein
MINYYRVGFHLALAIIPSSVSGFVAFVTASPITGDLREKVVQGGIAALTVFFLIFVPLCWFYGITDASNASKPYRGNLINLIPRFSGKQKKNG